MTLQDALVEALGREVEPAYLLDRKARIIFLNDAWNRIARVSEAPPEVLAQEILGRPWLEAVHGRFRRFYRALLARAFSLTRTSAPVALVHLSESNTPSRYRLVASRFVPLYPEDAVQAAWLLVVHAPVTEALIEARYSVRDVRTARAQCGCCRRVLAEDGCWVFSPAHVSRAASPRTDWALCPECRQRYYTRQQVEVLRRTRVQRLPKSAGLWLRTQAGAVANLQG